jgi:hypothetical protein
MQINHKKTKNMNNLKLNRIVALLVVGLIISHISMAQNQEWKLIKTNTKGDAWQVYSAKVPGSKLNQVKIVGQVNCSFEEAQKIAWEMILDSTMRISKKGKSLGYVKVLERSENRMVVYDFMKGGFLVRDRDVVVLYKRFKDSVNTIAGINWSQLDIKGYEPTDSIVRMPIATGSWHFEKIDSSSCMATENFRFHPGGNPPAWLINRVVKASIPIELKHLRGSVKAK